MLSIWVGDQKLLKFNAQDWLGYDPKTGRLLSKGHIGTKKKVINFSVESFVKFNLYLICRGHVDILVDVMEDGVLSLKRRWCSYLPNVQVSSTERTNGTPAFPESWRLSCAQRRTGIFCWICERFFSPSSCAPSYSKMPHNQAQIFVKEMFEKVHERGNFVVSLKSTFFWLQLTRDWKRSLQLRHRDLHNFNSTLDSWLEVTKSEQFAIQWFIWIA